MKSITLVPYTIRVRRLNSREDEPLDSFGESGEDLLDCIGRALQKLSEQDLRDENDKLLLGITKVVHDKRTLSGILETGEYGTASKIKDALAGKIVHLKERTHADMLPFYFLISLPVGRTKGLVLIQTKGVLGAAGIFRTAIDSAVRTEFPDYRVHLRPLTNRAMFDKYLAGNLREMRFIRFHLPKGIEDAYATGHEEIKGRTEFVVKPKALLGMPFAQKVRDILDGKSALQDLVELADEHFEAQEVKFNMELAGKRRLLSLSKPDKIEVGYDITSDVKMGADGHPAFESINEIATTFVSELEVAMYGAAGA